jgi:hypothetical protein
VVGKNMERVYIQSRTNKYLNNGRNERKENAGEEKIN